MRTVFSKVKGRRFKKRGKFCNVYKLKSVHVTIKLKYDICKQGASATHFQFALHNFIVIYNSTYIFMMFFEFFWITIMKTKVLNVCGFLYCNYGSCLVYVWKGVFWNVLKEKFTLIILFLKYLTSIMFCC